MNTRALRADSLLLLTSVVWGFAFVAQRVGMEFIGPFAYNGIRFALGSVSLLPLIYMQKKRSGASADQATAPVSRKLMVFGSLAAGIVLFIAASLQQIGIQFTTAGKAGFLTGLYVVLVPILGIALNHKTGIPTWIGAILAAGGMYILSAPDNLGTVNPGDILVIIGAFFWAIHVLLIDNLTKRLNPVSLASAQFAWCSLFSLVTAFLIEKTSAESVWSALIPILYGGLVSVGVGYTLQVVAQRDAPPAHAAILLSLEGVFATLGGILLLSEPLGLRNFAGSMLMLLGMFATQWDVIFRSPKA